MASNPVPQAETLIERIIGVSSRNAFLVVILTLFGVAGGVLVQIFLSVCFCQERGFADFKPPGPRPKFPERSLLFRLLL
jgi:hypothetical protein